MAFRALLFSKSPDLVNQLAPVLEEANIHAEVCSDIFSAIEKGTKQPYACVIADWMDQPEAGFLLKRARESSFNRRAATIAIVDRDPTPDEEREHRLEFLIYRPITSDEAAAVLAKARQQMQLHSAAFATDATAFAERAESEGPQEDPNLLETAANLPDALSSTVLPEPAGETDTLSDESTDSGQSRFRSTLRLIAVSLLLFTAGYFVWAAAPTFRYLATSREGAIRILRDSVSAVFNSARSARKPIPIEVQPDPYYTRTPSNPTRQSEPVGVISAGIDLSDGGRRLRSAYDFPLPVPELPAEPIQSRPKRAPLPESLRSSAPITPPPSITVTPGQMMPVSAAPPVSPIPSQYGDSIRLSEEAARALAVHTVDPVYPMEARAQKLQGPVVLQAVIGKDGSVQDLKLVRGYFVLGKAAIAAVKQWRFRPSAINGRAVEAHTTITVNFTYSGS